MRTKTLITIMIISFLVLPGISRADRNTKHKKLSKFVELFQLGDIAKEYKDSCVERFSVYSPETLIKDKEDYFGGIKPGSPYWKRLMTVWKQTTETTCSGLRESDIRRESIKAYEPLLTEEELDKIIAFYDSKTGKAFLKAELTAGKQMQRFYNKVAIDAMKKASEKFYSEYMSIMRDYSTNR